MRERNQEKTLEDFSHPSTTCREGEKEKPKWNETNYRKKVCPSSPLNRESSLKEGETHRISQEIMDRKKGS